MQNTRREQGVPAKKHKATKKQDDPPSPELIEIVRSVSGAERGAPLAVHLSTIRARRAQEAECCLRACAVRLRLREGRDAGV
jgi:hypothetical protein